MSVDPLTKSYPWYTPYQFAGNKPIWAIDLDGLEEDLQNLINEDISPKIDNLKPIQLYQVRIYREEGVNRPYKYQVTSSNDQTFELKLSDSEKWAVNKANFRNQNYLADRFINHWFKGRGADYIMNAEEMNSANVLPFSLQGTKFPRTGSRFTVSAGERADAANAPALNQLTNKLSEMKAGQQSPYSVTISGGVRTRGTLGQFSIKLSGTLRKISDTKYAFSGQYEFLMNMILMLDG